MRLVNDPLTQRVALTRVRELVAGGLAGLDEYDPDTFVVDVADPGLRDDAEVALDALGASFLRDDGQRVRCVLPRWVLEECALEAAPRLIVPLSPRRVRINDLIDEIGGDH